MMTKTKIEWTDRVWNPVTGCTKVSQGCKNCYAEVLAERFWGTQYPANADGSPRKFKDIRLHYDRLDQPIQWGKTCKVFVNSMSDLFHEDVHSGFIDEVFNTMIFCNHTFQILTKRPQRMLEYMQNIEKKHGIDWIKGSSPNVWLGVSVEDQATADERIPYLLQTPAAVRFVSCEPLLGPVDLQKATWFNNSHESKHSLPPNSIGLDWVICGGESGPHARPMHPDWARSLRDQCVGAGVPYFFKQWGEWYPIDGKYPRDLLEKPMHIWTNQIASVRLGKKLSGCFLDGRTWDEFPHNPRWR